MSESVEPETCQAFELFREWCDRPENSQAKVAKALNVSKPSVHAWYTRVSRPKPHLRRPLAELTEGFVPERAWALPSEVEAEEAAFARIRSVPDEDPAPSTPPQGAA